MNKEIGAEEKTAVEISAENERASEEVSVREELISREKELCDALEAAKAENEYLKAKCICSELGVPAGITEDVICLGRFYAQKDGVDFSEAARAAYARISAGGRSITTGVAGSRLAEDGSALRRAFGLKG